MVLAEPRPDGPARGPRALSARAGHPRPVPARSEPVSNNRVDLSPYYPVFGRRMVMIGYARRLQDPSHLLDDRLGRRTDVLRPVDYSPR